MKRNNLIVFGSEGMLGNMLIKYMDTRYNILKINRAVFDANLNMNKIDDLIKTHLDATIINCIGVTQDKIISKNSINLAQTIDINSKFPHILSSIANKYNCRTIHISTDAVFDKNCGIVSEKHTPNPDNFYGLTKLIGEPINPQSLTVRTSIIGPAIDINNKSLWNWLINEKKIEINGYINSIWSGCTTLQLSEFIETLIDKKTFFDYRNKTTVIHFCPNSPITKFELIKKIVDELKLNLKVIKSKKEQNECRILKSEFYQRSNQIQDDWSFEIKRLNHFQK
tara:strand:+ start:638 stop:1483 length:846 start_codon:yes stop_codon:yes gene_type:complete